MNAIVCAALLNCLISPRPLIEAIFFFAAPAVLRMRSCYGPYSSHLCTALHPWTTSCFPHESCLLPLSVTVSALAVSCTGNVTSAACDSNSKKPQKKSFAPRPPCFPVLLWLLQCLTGLSHAAGPRGLSRSAPYERLQRSHPCSSLSPPPLYLLSQKRREGWTL